MQQNIENLKNAIACYETMYDVVYSKTVRKDLSTVSVCFENMEPFGTEDSYNHLPGLRDLGGYEMVGSGENAFPILWCAGGGDWELPLVFVLYLDKEGKVRGYIPSDGNAYNHEDKAAYGNNENDPLYSDNDPRYMFDVEKMRADIIKSLQQR